MDSGMDSNDSWHVTIATWCSKAWRKRTLQQPLQPGNGERNKCFEAWTARRPARNALNARHLVSFRTQATSIHKLQRPWYATCNNHHSVVGSEKGGNSWKLVAKPRSTLHWMSIGYCRLSEHVRNKSPGPQGTTDFVHAAHHPMSRLPTKQYNTQFFGNIPRAMTGCPVHHIL